MGLGRSVLALLSGLAQGVPKGLQEFNAVTQRQQQLDEQRRQFDVTEQRHQEQMNTPLEQLPPEIRNVVGAGQTSVRSNVIPLLEKIIQRQREAAAAQQVGGVIKEMGPQPGPWQEGLEKPGISPVQALGRVLQIPGLTPTQATLAQDVLKVPPPKPPEPFTLGPDQQRYDPTGKVIATGLPKPEKMSEGERKAAEIHDYLVNVRKLTPGTPQYRTEFMDWRNRPITIFPGGGSFKATDVMGGQGQPAAGGAPAVGAPPTAAGGPQPVVSRPPTPPPIGTEQTANLADFRTLLGQLDKVERLYNPAYIGPIEGRLGALKGFTGIGATEAEADYRSELASVQNTLIYLKSGKQINEQEYERLRRELPEPNDPEPFFKAKLRRAQGLVQTMLANREAEFKARGYRGESPPSATPPPAQQGGGVIRYERDPATGRLRPVP